MDMGIGFVCSFEMSNRIFSNCQVSFLFFLLNRDETKSRKIIVKLMLSIDRGRSFQDAKDTLRLTKHYFKDVNDDYNFFIRAVMNILIFGFKTREKNHRL